MIRTEPSVLPRPRVELVDWRKYRWVLLEDYTVTWDGVEYGTRQGVRIPAGFEFDLASVPRAFWWRISPTDLSIVAPLVHDYLYRYQGKPPGYPFPVARAEVDRVNGPGEAKEADIGLACGRGSGVIFKRGKVLRKVAAARMTDEFIAEVLKLAS